MLTHFNFVLSHFNDFYFLFYIISDTRHVYLFKDEKIKKKELMRNNTNNIKTNAQLPPQKNRFVCLINNNKFYCLHESSKRIESRLTLNTHTV